MLQAPPGAGKTTRVPLALLNEPWLGDQRILMLEPRRLAARAVANYMAVTLGERVGETVGYRVRRESRVGPLTRIEVVTEGILTRAVQRDPTLEGIGLVIFDEFHERSVHADLGLALTLHARELLRRDLRVLVMSATLDGSAVAALLRDAAVITSEGRAHHVDVSYRDRPAERDLGRTVAAEIEHALQEETGDVLVFLPGGREIRQVARLLEARQLLPGVRVMPLYGDLPLSAQTDAIAASRAGDRKVVLSTPIAETSFTIEGVTTVIDSGLARESRFSPRTGMSRLETVRISRSSAEQRAGRAGRVRPGTCRRLWSENEQQHLQVRSTPEILQTDIAPLALQLAAAGITDPSELRWIDPPPAVALQHARQVLRELGALDAGGAITRHGRAMSELPAHPRVAHMLIAGGERGMGAIACDLAALLGERDVMRAGNHPPEADIVLRLELLRDLRSRDNGRRAATDERFDSALLSRINAEAAALRRQLRFVASGYKVADAGVVLALAYPDRVGKARGNGLAGRRFTLRNGRGAVLRRDDPLGGAEFVVAADVDGGDVDARIYIAAALTEIEIRSLFADAIQQVETVECDADTGRVRARRVERLGAIVLRDSPATNAAPSAAATALLARIRADGLQRLTWTDAASQLRARIGFVRLHDDAHDAAWPNMDDSAMTDAVAEWLHDLAGTGTSLSSIADINVEAVIRSKLTWSHRAELDRMAPTQYVTPAGSRITIDYGDPAGPSISVRLQEMFGVRATPTVLGGRLPLSVQLLSPANRPIQTTRDLAGFWCGSYFDVRKELRGRYPKHQWPEDPSTALPTRRAKPRRV